MAKALVKAADAAAAKNPRPHVPPPAEPEVISPRPRQSPDAETVRQTVRQVQQGQARLFEQGQRAGKAALAPMTNALGVLWLEITGVFFGIFALAIGTEAWRHRADLLIAGSARNHAAFVLAVALVFLYFAVSSFLKARRRGR